MKTARAMRHMVLAAASAATLMGMLAPATAYGATRTWTGLGVSATPGDFADPANWNVNTPTHTAPASTTYTDIARFSLANPGSVNQPVLTGNREINALEFTTAGWTLSGNYNLLVGWNDVVSSGSGTNTISANLTWNDNNEFRVGTGNRLIFNGGLNQTSNFYTIKSGVGTLEFGGTLTQTGVTKAFQVTAGTLEMKLANTAKYVWVRTGGTALLMKANQFSDVNSTDYVAVDGTGLLDLNGYSSTARQIHVGSLAATGVGNGGGGTIDVKDGTLSGTTLNMKGGTIQGTTGAVSVTGAITSDVTATATSLISSRLVLNTGAGSIVTNDGTAATDLSITGEISGTPGITKTGDGTLELSGANLYGGNTAINAGRLLVNNASGSATGSGAVTIASVATLGGGGFLGSGGVTIDGTIAPGNSIGDIDLLQNATINGTYLLEADLSGSSDLINVDGLLTLGAASVLDLDSLSELDPETTYTIATYGTRLGEFASVDAAITATHEVDYVTGDSIRLVPIPEPTSLAALAFGSLLLAGRRRRD